MTCSYGPYKITSELEAVGETGFIDKNLSRRVAVFADCVETTNPPCAAAVAVHTENGCPDGCKIIWYECPSEMGRQYTILPTPCGVKVTSFEDGLVAVDGCDATIFGSETFCFGRVYTNLGAFDSPDKSLTVFEFDGHTFSVQGNIGECNELYNCPDCQTSSSPEVTAFETLPTPPDDIRAPEPPTDDEVISDINTPETEVIPAEGRMEWHWDATTTSFGQDIMCESEKPLTGWPGGAALPTCASNDNPSIATLPSGHTVVAYENRGEDGIAKISVAILSSSVRENVRSHRKLGTGTLINDLVEAEGIATFIIYEDMHIPVVTDPNGNPVPAAGEKIGFLSGPLVGSLFTITRLERLRSNDTIRHELKFTAPNVVFPDKNNIYDINWFIIDNQGSEDLPSTENVTTILDLPNHVDGEGNNVPVANPSVAVAQNNQMVINEQNIYVAYQAFENDQWRVYLREIVLGTTSVCSGGGNDGVACSRDLDCPGGTCSGGIPPTYIAPYLFNEDVRQVEIMAAPTVEVMGDIPEIVFYNETFSGAGLNSGLPIDTTGRWKSLSNTHIPAWWWFDSSVGVADWVSYRTMPLVLCDAQGPPGSTGLPSSGCTGTGGTSCSVVFNSQACEDVGDDSGESVLILDHTRSFVVSETPTLLGGSLGAATDISFKMRFHVVVNQFDDTGIGINEYPEIWFLIGWSTPASIWDWDGFGEGYRLQIRRGKNLYNDSMSRVGGQYPHGVRECSHECAEEGECFIFSLYERRSPQWQGGMDNFNDWIWANGSQEDMPTRVIWKCIPTDDIGERGDYNFDDWNEWRVDTYLRGNYRLFDVYHTHSDGTERLMANFREWDWSLGAFAPPTQMQAFDLGLYHGFGFAQTHHGHPLNRSRHQVLVDSFSATSIPRAETDKIYFFENYCERNGLQVNAPESIVSFQGPAMFSEGIAENTDYDSSELHYRDYVWDGYGDRFYSTENLQPVTHEAIIRLGPLWNQNSPPKGWAAYLRVLPSAVARTPGSVGTSHQDAVTMIISVNRQWRVHSGAWPHVWMVGRLFSNVVSESTGKWYSRYRLRISRFRCQSNYPGLGTTGFSLNDQVWRLSAYNSGSGLNTDVAAAEEFLLIGTDTPLDWIEYASSGGGGQDGTSHAVWNYFRIDMYDDAGLVKFDVYVGDDTAINHPLAPKVHPDDIDFTLLSSLTVPTIGSGADGPFFGAAFFSGTEDESAEGLIGASGGDDYRSSAHINYISLTTMGAAGSSSIGACCRFIGGCTPDVFSADCPEGDIWKSGQTCAEAACEVNFPIGAGCTSDGRCHGGLTAIEAANQGIPDVRCTGDCEWIAGTDCLGGATDRGCPDEATVLGRCCRPYRVNNVPRCVGPITLEACQVYYGGGNPFGNFLPDGECSQGCPIISNGACCTPSGCAITRASTCQGTFYPSHDCVSIVTVLAVDCQDGACCDGGGCTQRNEAECNAAGSTFLGIGISCAPDPCASPDPIAACCFDDGTCTDTVEAACGLGTWISTNTCADLPCAEATGACCNGFTGECEDGVTAADCVMPRTYLGNGSVCSSVSCTQPTGACCIDFNCFGDQTIQQCTDVGGSYLGDFSNCIEGICLEDTDGDQDPYLDISIRYKPEDLWIIETAPNEYVTRVLYHMQEVILSSSLQTGTTSVNTNNTIDFMFLIDHSISMSAEIIKIVVAVPQLAAQMLTKGLDARFGFTFFGRGVLGTPIPAIRRDCFTCSSMANGLQLSSACRQSSAGLDGSHDNGFTRSTDYLQLALNCWGVETGTTAPWAAIQYVLEGSEFVWREDAAKFIFFVTDTDSNECNNCSPWIMTAAAATTALLDTGAVLIPVVNQSKPIDDYVEVAEASGWNAGPLDVSSEDYGDLFEQVINSIDSILRVDNATVMERATRGTDATFLKKGEVLITYDGDLSDLWTFNKEDFEFNDLHVPFPGTNTKQLVEFPFDLASGKIYGVDSVHIQGNPSNWISFGNEGALIYSHPNVGHRASGTSNTPVLVSVNSARPKVYVNNRNQVMVAYENYSTGASQIEIQGTGDFHQNSITGPKASRIVRLLNQSDFAYNHVITLPGEGVNQLCDFVIDNSDITHIVWQSSRDAYWEIYYANSFNMFDPVRITQFESRSSHPSIDIDETGSIFVVYHDDRFGPFNIMLSTKDEERVIPLLEQDAYFASLRSGYTHYTNLIPLFLDNPSGEIPDLGRFWGNKNENGAGNDSENYVYQVSETTGTPSKGFSLDSFTIIRPQSLAFSSTALWGISNGGELYKLGSIGDNNDIVTFTPVLVGTIKLELDGFQDAQVLDMAVDKFDRIWVLIYEIEDSGGVGFSMTPSGLPLVHTFTIDHRLRLEYVSGFNASMMARGVAMVDDVDGPDGGSLAITSDNKFHVTWDNSGEFSLSESDYPNIVGRVANFDFSRSGDLTPTITPVAMTADANDTLFVVDSGNDLYTVSKLSAGTTLQTSLTAGSGDAPTLPVGTTSGLAYQMLDVEITGSGEFFHIRLDFYDNIAFEGDVFLSVDSRENLEAFINDETLDDPYISPYAAFGMDARGIFLRLDEIGIVFFDATHFVPGFSRLAQPYTFEPNQTYFPKVFLINANDGVRESGLPQPNSFSCSKCSRFGNNNFNTSACSYSFVMPNVETDTQSFNFQIDFYADVGKQHLIRRFEAIPGSDDLQYMEVDNEPAIGQWTSDGLPIIAGDSAFIQIHPVLDPTAGFLCGVTYTVHVNECHGIGERCSNFSQISPSNWFASLVGDKSHIIDDTIEADDEVMLGLSMRTINNKLSVAWRTPDENLKFSQLDDDGWTTQFVVGGPKVDVKYLELTEINGVPAMAVVALQDGSHTIETVFSLIDGAWTSWTAMEDFQASVLSHPRALLEYDNAPMIAYISTSGGGQPTFELNSGSSDTWHLDPSCHPRFAAEDGGSCTVTLANINGLPAASWISLGIVRYSTWNTTNENFDDPSTVSNTDLIHGKIALAEVNGQPAIAYIQKTPNNLGVLKYTRFDGSSWINIPTNGQVRDFNKHVDMAVINGKPYIAYSVKTSSTTSQLRFAYYNGSRFVDELVEDDLNQVDHVVGITEYNNEPAIIISANPFRVYFFRTQPSQSVNEIRPVFFCECSSKIFTNRLTHLHEVARWESSAHGFSDTPVTDSPKDSLRPTIRTRKTNAAIIIWEDHNKSNNCDDPPCIRAATFRNVNQDQLRGSGTKYWFDYDFGISGQDSDLALDLYERVNAIYEKPKPSKEGLHGHQLSPDELPGNELYGKVCDFAITAEATSVDPGPGGSCDISALENNAISFDQFISSNIVRKIRVKDDFVQYHTYNASGKLTPIVSTCNIALEIHGTPEIVALRFRNENKVVWGPWCPWSPQISDFVMEKGHRISGGSGVKEVCIQAMTYIGITTEFCLPIVADYETVIFETLFYKSTDSEGNEITNFSDVASGFFPADLDEKLVALPLSDGISVASLGSFAGGGGSCTENSDCPDGQECVDGRCVCIDSSGCGENEICLGGRCVPKTARILVEIIPSQTQDEEAINFDVIQQGSNDQRGIVSKKGKNNDGRVLYRGEFTIEREDKVFNTDGLARVNPTFPSACEDAGSETVSVSDTYTRDSFNEAGEDITVEETETIDSLSDFRQTTTGRIGVTLDIRSSEDPYFVFGDPDYSLHHKDGRRLGVPFQIAETDIVIGSDVDQSGGACPPLPGGCPEGFVRQPYPDCSCQPPPG